MCKMEDMDYEKLAIELVRELRGRRSQSAFSRRLGFRSNAVHAWEAGRAFPTAASFFRAAKRVGRDVDAALASFYRVPLERGQAPDLTTREGVARLLNDLRGRTSVVNLAETARRSRFAVARWLKGSAEPRLPDFLRLVECASLRLLDFLACFSDPAKLPSVANAWQTLESARRAVYELPWSHAVLRVIELEAYRSLKRHRPGFIADWLQIPREEEERCVALLLESGQIRKERGRLIPGASLTVDTRRDPERSRQVKAWWANVARERLLRGVEGTFSYNLFSVSRADLERIQELHRAYFRELRRIVADSEPSESIALATVHLLELGPSRKVAG
jgi:transcriptional regulator with XRE-family HTH domain